MNQEPKQYIVMRKDLNMRKGKMVAQGAHAVMKIVLMNLDTPAYKEWLDSRFKKICVGVKSEEELLTIYAKAEELGLPCAMTNDLGLTEFDGVETKTCCAIGPAYPDDFQGIMDDLKLL